MASDAVAVVLVPVARPTVELGHAVGLLVQEARPQHVGEELVVAIPAPPVVERDEEEVPAIERLQHRLAALVTGDGIAERASQPIQDRGLQQEAPDLLGLTVQDLVDQVVDDVAVVPGESRDEAGDVVAALDRERCQLEGGDPPFGPRLQRDDSSLASRSSPITSLRYAAASSGVKRRSAARISTSSPRARRRASGSAGSARVVITRCSCGGRCSSRNAHPVLDVVRVDDVVVVEHQHDVARQSAELVEQRGKDRCDRRLGATPGARARSRRPRAPPSAAQRSSRARRMRPGCRLGRARATPWAVHLPERLPATRPAGWSCRSRRARRRGSASTRHRGSGARSVSDVSPDRVAAWGCRAWSRAAGLP